MAYFPENISETEFVLCPEPELATYDCGNYDEFQEDWPSATVGTAVTQGKKLRQCKPSAKLHNEYEVGIDCVKPCQEIRNHRKSKQRSCYDICNSPYTPTYSPPCEFCTSGSLNKSYKKSQISRPRHKQCPLRIIELAAPTKRHCLETWKDNADILPDYMLNRIRQYVMDEKPMAQIPDALNCFKRRVSSKRRSRSSKFKVSDACMSDMSRYSAIFAHCVAQKLDKPLNITLNPKLEKISKIVSYEIGRMSSTKSKKSKNNIKNKRNKFEKQIKDEMSKKVTAWIEDILEDTSDKLLQDALRELEEEEGPVLDIIDDLIDYVVTSCEPEEDDKAPNQLPEDIKTVPALIGEAKGNNDGADDEENDNNKADKHANVPLENYITQVIYAQVDAIISKGEDELSTFNFDSRLTESGTKSTDNTNNVTNTNISNESIHSVSGNTNILTNTLTENNLNNDTSNETEIEEFTNEETKDEIKIVEENYGKSDGGKENNMNSDIPNENVDGDNINEETKDEAGKVEENYLESDDEKENNLKSDISNENEARDIIDEETDEPGKIEENHVESDSKKENNSHTNDETGGTANVSSLYTNSEESLDDLNKTVKFSKVDDGFGPIVNIFDDQILLFENGTTGKTKTFGEKSNVVFTTPKEHLLRDADESWPSDISIGGRKLTDSVSKSVISLGPLYETAEEKQAIDESSYETGAHDSLDMLGTHNDVKKSQALTTGQNYLETGADHTINEILDKENNIYELEYSAINKQDMKHLEDDTSVQIFEEPVLPTKKVNYILDLQIMFHEQEVDAKSAPSWLVSGHCDKGKGEPEDSFLKHDQNDKYEINEVDVRKWIENLEIMSENLLIWNEWIKTTCRTVKHIKRKSERVRKRCTNTYRHKDIDYWLKLEKYVYKDARMWLKLKHRAKKQLKTYDSYFRPKQYDTEIQTIKCNCEMDHTAI